MGARCPQVGSFRVASRMGGTLGEREANVRPAARPAIVLEMEMAHRHGADGSVVTLRATTTETSLLTAITER